MLNPTRSIVLVLAALAASCVVPGHVRAVKTADRLEDLKVSIAELKDVVDSAATSLAGVVAAKAQDPTEAYKHFVATVDALESAQRRTESRVELVRDEADAYFLSWKQQAATIEDEDLKESSEERRADLAKAVELVEERMKPAHEALVTYLAALHDSEKYLSIDLSPGAIGAVEGRAKGAAKSAKSINEKLDELLEAVDEAAPLFAAHRPAPQPAQHKKSEPAAQPQSQN